MTKQDAMIKAEFIAELNNRKVEAIKSGLSPLEWLKTTRVYVEDWNENEWFIAFELEKYYKNKQNEI